MLKILRKIFFSPIFFLRKIVLAQYRLETGRSIKFVAQGEGGLTLDGDSTNFYIGRSSHLKSNTYIDLRGSVSIGDHFHVGRSLTIFSSDHNWRSHESLPYSRSRIIRPVEIGDYVWIGANVTVLPGSVIEDGVVVGAGSIVTGTLEKGGVYAGNPVKKIASRDLEVMADLAKKSKFI